MADDNSQSEQDEAFEAYKRAKIRTDETLDRADAELAKQAWWRFLHIFESRTAAGPTKR